MFQEMNTDASVALLCLEVTKGEEELVQETLH
jgi:hypothetical protein